MEPATHIIGRQKIRLRYQGTTDTFALRQLISSVCNDELPARLNRLLDQYDEEDLVLRIDRLDVQVSVNDDGNLRETLARAIIEKIEAALRRKLERRDADASTIDKSFSKMLRFYLERGYLPWWGLAKDGAALRRALEQALDGPSLDALSREVVPVLSSAAARGRLLPLLSEIRFDAIVMATTAWRSEDWNAWKRFFALLKQEIAGQISEPALERLIRDAVLRVIAEQLPDAAAGGRLAELLDSGLRHQGVPPFDPMVRSWLPAAVRQAFIPHPLSIKKTGDLAANAEGNTTPARSLPPKASQSGEDKASQPEGGEHILIANAGLVILALYLPALFTNTDILKDGRLQNADRAVTLLRYMVFEDAAFEEYDLILEKILCGIPLSEHVDIPQPVTTEDREQVEALLESVIEHWPALKSTTPGGLRLNFLQREGQLAYQGQWELKVQRQAHDILLDFLPWNISMIKLPWMKEIITVKWNN
jgi:hypothetical protein